MEAHLTSLTAGELQRTVLRELIEQAKPRDPRSAVTGARGASEKGSALHLPEAVRVVLSDERASNVISRLVAVNAVRLTLDVKALTHACECIERQWWEEALLQYFVGARASTAMIQTFFRHVSRSRVEQLRRELKVTPPTKPAALTDGELARVFDLWSELQKKEFDERERYVELHERCAARYTLATLFAVLRLDEDGRCARRVARYAAQKRAIDEGKRIGGGNQIDRNVSVTVRAEQARSVAHECF